MTVGGRKPRPRWLTVTAGETARFRQVTAILGEYSLRTVCSHSACPNLYRCFDKGVATFLILGGTCTRGCLFCDISAGRPDAPDPDEPRKVAAAVDRLGLRHAVITSVTRDDLSDGGASHFVVTIGAVRSLKRDCSIEVLIPDLRASLPALESVLAAKPEILSHNIETVPRLYESVRPGAAYSASIRIIRFASSHGQEVKSGIMLGMGESPKEVIGVLQDLRDAGCSRLTIGQYLSPSPAHWPVSEYVSPQRFRRLAAQAREMGFETVVSEPLARTSYQS